MDQGKALTPPSRWKTAASRISYSALAGSSWFSPPSWRWCEGAEYRSCARSHPGGVNFLGPLPPDSLHLQLPAPGARELRTLRDSRTSLCAARSVSLAPERPPSLVGGWRSTTSILAAASAIGIHHVAGAVRHALW